MRNQILRAAVKAEQEGRCKTAIRTTCTVEVFKSIYGKKPI